MLRLKTIKQPSIFHLVKWVVISSLFSLPVQSNSYFKCTDGNGKLSFQTLPCPPASVEEEEITTTSEKPAPAPNRETFGKSEYSDETTHKTQPGLTNSKLASVLASLSPLKVLNYEYFLTHGKWPKNFQVLGLNARDMISSQIDAVKLGTSGGIVARLSTEFGKNKYLAIKPLAVLGGTSLEWQCFANFPQETLNYSGHSICESRSLF